MIINMTVLTTMALCLNLHPLLYAPENYPVHVDSPGRISICFKQLAKKVIPFPNNCVKIFASGLQYSFAMGNHGFNWYHDNLAVEEHFDLLQYAIAHNRLDIVGHVLENKYDWILTSTSMFIKTPFMMACIYGRTKIVELLIEKVKPNDYPWFFTKRSANGKDALEYALEVDKYDIVKLLLDRKVYDPYQYRSHFGLSFTDLLLSGNKPNKYSKILKKYPDRENHSTIYVLPQNTNPCFSQNEIKEYLEFKENFENGHEGQLLSALLANDLKGVKSVCSQKPSITGFGFSDRGLLINVSANDTFNALILAIFLQYDEIVWYLVDDHPLTSLHFLSSERRTVIWHAINVGRMDYLILLVSATKDKWWLNQKDSLGFGPLDIAVRWGERSKYLLIALVEGLDVGWDYIDPDGFSLLDYAVFAGNVDLYSYLREVIPISELDYLANSRLVPGGNTLLHFCISDRSWENVKSLCELVVRDFPAQLYRSNNVGVTPEQLGTLISRVYKSDGNCTEWLRTKSSEYSEHQLENLKLEDGKEYEREQERANQMAKAFLAELELEKQNEETRKSKSKAKSKSKSKRRKSKEFNSSASPVDSVVGDSKDQIDSLKSNDGSILDEDSHASCNKCFYGAEFSNDHLNRICWNTDEYVNTDQDQPCNSDIRFQIDLDSLPIINVGSLKILQDPIMYNTLETEIQVLDLSSEDEFFDTNEIHPSLNTDGDERENSLCSFYSFADDETLTKNPEIVRKLATVVNEHEISIEEQREYVRKAYGFDDSYDGDPLEHPLITTYQLHPSLQIKRLREREQITGRSYKENDSGSSCCSSESSIEIILENSSGTIANAANQDLSYNYAYRDYSYEFVTHKMKPLFADRLKKDAINIPQKSLMIESLFNAFFYLTNKRDAFILACLIRDIWVRFKDFDHDMKVCGMRSLFHLSVLSNHHSLLTVSFMISVMPIFLQVGMGNFFLLERFVCNDIRLLISSSDGTPLPSATSSLDPLLVSSLYELWGNFAIDVQENRCMLQLMDQIFSLHP